MTRENLIFEEILAESSRRERMCLSESASFSADARREYFSSDDSGDFRLPYAHDIDRIVHSKGYARYQDKTQVFSQVENDHISRRIHHVQMVTRIARTIGRALRLNEDLIEAIALGHDIGHTPFGHAGESVLAQILEERGKGSFLHNAQSVRIFRKLEKGGKGLNLTLQTLDGILGHNGEIESSEYTCSRDNLDWKILEDHTESCFTEPNISRPDIKIVPSTLEGCVVRVSDMIAYVGKDLQDAVTLGIVKGEDVPSSITDVLGTSNAEMIDRLVKDIVIHSAGISAIRFSEKVYDAFTSLKSFNYAHIYRSPLLNRQRKKLAGILRYMFDECLRDLEEGEMDTPICSDYLAGFGGTDSLYFQTESPERITADYIAGMTDDYFISLCNDMIMPRRIRYRELRKAEYGKE